MGPRETPSVKRPPLPLRKESVKYLLGYRNSQVEWVLPAAKKVKENSKYKRHDIGEERIRVARSLGWNVKNLAPLAPDPMDPTLVEKGAKYRFMRRLPKVSNYVRQRFREFVRIYIRKHLVPLVAQSDTSFETWLASTDYPEWRKDQLRKAKLKNRSSNMYKNKSHIKREFYRQIKHARWINSRTDKFKAETGPIFKLVEKEIFKKKCFIKKVPVSERAAYIKERLFQVGATYVGTDFSAFEAMFDIDTVNCIEMQLYAYMTQALPEADRFMSDVRKGIASGQKCYKTCKRHKHVAHAEARMSGDMCTSLGNGFTNLMIMKFVCSELGWSKCKGVVEGDDGLFRVAGKMPTEEDFAKVGSYMVMDVCENLGEAGFCHLYSSDDKPENLIDPMYAVLRSGWTMSPMKDARIDKLHTLSKAKAFSLLCEAPANPITGSLARWIIRATSNVEARVDWRDPSFYRYRQIMSGTHLRECFERSLIGPTDKQRDFVLRKWGISINDQLRIEEYFDSQSEIHEIDCPIINHYLRDWEYSWSYYNLVEKLGTQDSWGRSPM